MDIVTEHSSISSSGNLSATNPFPAKKGGVFLHFHQFLVEVSNRLVHFSSYPIAKQNFGCQKRLLVLTSLDLGEAHIKRRKVRRCQKDEPSHLRAKLGTKNLNSQHRQNDCVPQLLLPAYKSKLAITVIFDVISHSRSQVEGREDEFTLKLTSVWIQ